MVRMIDSQSVGRRNSMKENDGTRLQLRDEDKWRGKVCKSIERRTEYFDRRASINIAVY